MPKITDTYALAYACCETILKELQRFPTIELIRERIGVNSPNTIKKAMNDWTAAFAKHYIEQQQSPFDCPGVPTVLTDTVYQLWQATVTEAQHTYTEQAAVLHQQLSHLQHTIAQQQNTMLEYDQALAQAGVKLENLETQLAVGTANHALLQTELLATQQREQNLLTTQKQHKQWEIELGEQHRQRLQQEQDWMQRRILEERELAIAKEHAKKQQLEQRLTFLTAHLEQTQHALQTAQRHNQQLLAEIVQLNTLSEKTKPTVLPAHRFKRHRDRRQSSKK